MHKRTTSEETTDYEILHDVRKLRDEDRARHDAVLKTPPATNKQAEIENICKSMQAKLNVFLDTELPQQEVDSLKRGTKLMLVSMELINAMLDPESHIKQADVEDLKQRIQDEFDSRQ